jgi:hypothetical protein
MPHTLVGEVEAKRREKEMGSGLHRGPFTKKSEKGKKNFRILTPILSIVRVLRERSSSSFHSVTGEADVHNAISGDYSVG